MAGEEKDKFGDTLRLVERAKEDIYFAERDRELMAKLKAQLCKVENAASLRCPRCSGTLESYTFHGYALDRCSGCGGIWMDRGELEGVVRKISRGPLGEWLDTLTAKS